MKTIKVRWQEPEWREKIGHRPVCGKTIYETTYTNVTEYGWNDSYCWIRYYNKDQRTSNKAMYQQSLVISFDIKYENTQS